MLEIVPKGMTKWQWENRHVRLWDHPDMCNQHEKDLRNQPGYFEKFVLPKLKAEK